jgi:hypothetical protein
MKKKIIITLVLTVAMSWIIQPICAQEAKYYALFIAKFTDYIHWPSSNDKIVIGIYGDQEIISELGKFTASKERIEIRNISSLADAEKCQIIFLSDSKNGEFENINKGIGNREILLVTENENFAEQGAGISFFLDDAKLRFRLNKQAMDSRNLKVSGSLLSLAEVI